MRKKTKKFDFAEGKYYFTIKSTPNHITIHRESKVEAHQAYHKYFDLGKKMEWLGKWEGKKFIETTAPAKEKPI